MYEDHQTLGDSVWGYEESKAWFLKGKGSQSWDKGLDKQRLISAGQGACLRKTKVEEMIEFSH